MIETSVKLSRFSWDWNGHKISLLFEIWQQLSLFCSNYLCLSLWRDPTSPLLAAVVHLGWSGRHLIQIIVAIPGRPCRAPGPQLLSQPHSHSLECEYSLPGHIIIGSVVFVLLPKGFIAGPRGPFQAQQVQCIACRQCNVILKKVSTATCHCFSENVK